MEKKFFHHFIEVQSLQNKIKIHLKQIEEHQKRIMAVKEQQLWREKQREKTVNDLDEKKKLLGKKENELFAIDRSLEKLENKLKLVKNQLEYLALQEEEKREIINKKDREGEAFQLMEEIEQLNLDVKQAKSFLEGSEKTLTIITAQVAKDVKEENRHIENYNERISLLINELPPAVKNRVTKIFEHFKFKNPLTYAQNNVCITCHLNVTRALADVVEKGTTINDCPGCGRILIPTHIESSIGL